MFDLQNAVRLKGYTLGCYSPEINTQIEIQSFQLVYSFTPSCHRLIDLGCTGRSLLTVVTFIYILLLHFNEATVLAWGVLRQRVLAKNNNKQTKKRGHRAKNFNLAAGSTFTCSATSGIWQCTASSQSNTCQCKFWIDHSIILLI